jgi:hypothetical protein
VNVKAQLEEMNSYRDYGAFKNATVAAEALGELYQREINYRWGAIG